MDTGTHSKPQIIVIAISIDPRRGSEPGKGWWWASALSRHFRLHIITQPHSLIECEPEALPKSDGWTFHPTTRTVTTWKFPAGYWQYGQLLKEMREISRRIIEVFPIQGLCHVTLGSFRILPRYDRLGIPYTVGPLGGGECSPLAITLKRPTPLSDKITESLRPLLNNASALVPPLRACLRSATLVLNTSRETEAVVRRMGARQTAVVFPDAYTNPIDMEKVSAARAGQTGAVKDRIRLIWQGRAFWWKGPDIALEVVQAASQAGIRLQLSLVTRWNPSYRRSLEELVQKMEIADQVDFLEGTARDEFLQLMGEHHGMLATSLHDSGGIPLIEAQALGLPCFTFGLGGHGLAACPEAGVSESAHRISDFVAKSVSCLKRWQDDPGTWLDESRKAAAFSTRFTIDRLADDVGRLIVPCFARDPKA